MTFLGIELGSTRIKAVLTDKKGKLLAQGWHNWENRFENGIWTYHIEDIWTGLQESFKGLVKDYQEKSGATFPDITCIGISAMMHGYLPLDEVGEPLAEFRTWRNTITETEATHLTELFGFNIPQRWSIAHLYRAMAGNEAHINQIKILTTLAGYVHYKLCGQSVLGIGDASGVFPIGSAAKSYNSQMVNQFDEIAAKHNMPWRLLDILPKVLNAGENAGTLTKEGAMLLDPTGKLTAGIALCPPEGDAGTGMVATNSIAAGTGNVLAGTSVFAMLVLEKELSRLYPEIDMVTTPTGLPVAMVHCNNCTSDLDAWVSIFGQALTRFKVAHDKSDLYKMLYTSALEANADAGGLISCNYLSGEHITGFHEGRPIFARSAQSNFTLENFMRNLIFSAISTLKIGLDILIDGEGVSLSKLLGHGGFFKTPEVGQMLMASALNIPVAVMESADEGGAWGIAILAAYAACKGEDESLEEYLADKIFADAGISVANPNEADTKGFEVYLSRYKNLLEVERAAIEAFN